MAYTVTSRSTRDDGRPSADLRDGDRWLRVIGPDAHGLVEGRCYDLSFTDVGEAPKPVPAEGHIIPLVQIALAGSVVNPE